jgi:hypothetical protein
MNTNETNPEKNQNRKTVFEVMLACFIGGFIGTTIALTKHIPWLPWEAGLLTGLVTGALIGRTCYHPIELLKDIWAGLEKAWTSVTGINIPKVWTEKEMNARVCYLITALTWFIPLIVFAAYHWDTLMKKDSELTLGEKTVEIRILGLIVFAIMANIFQLSVDGEYRRGKYSFKKFLERNVITGSVNTVLRFLLPLIIMGAAEGLKALNKKEGLLVMLSSAVGVLVGCYFKSSIIGGLAGASCGCIELHFRVRVDVALTSVSEKMDEIGRKGISYSP